MRFAILADDLSGASDTGVQLARVGHRSLVWFGLVPIPAGFDGVALDLDSRHCSPTEAARRVTEAVGWLAQVPLLYKKIDSTLRGNIAAEIAAALQASGRTRVIIAPAFPSAGRVTKVGVQYVDGLPVHQSSFAHDSQNPVRESHIPTLLANGGLSGVEVLKCSSFTPSGLENSPILVADIETEADFAQLIDAVQNPEAVLWVGSAGLLRALAEKFPGSSHIPKKATASRTLIVVGSLNPKSRAQLEHLRSQIPSFELNQDLAQARDLLERHSALVLYSNPSPTNPTHIAQALAEAVFDLQESFDGLVLTGGDTALRVLRRLGVQGIELQAELQPGIPLGRTVGKDKHFWVVIKAGGFGSADALTQAYRVLSGV